MFDVVYSNHPQKSSTSLLIFYKKIVSFDSKIGQLGLLWSNQKWSMEQSEMVTLFFAANSSIQGLKSVLVACKTVDISTFLFKN